MTATAPNPITLWGLVAAVAPNHLKINRGSMGVAIPCAPVLGVLRKIKSLGNSDRLSGKRCLGAESPWEHKKHHHIIATFFSVVGGMCGAFQITSNETLIPGHGISMARRRMNDFTSSDVPDLQIQRDPSNFGRLKAPCKKYGI